MATKRVNTATLIRGEIYTMRHPHSTPQSPKDPVRFEYGKPVVITDSKLLDTLENLIDLTEDGDGDQYEKPRFKISKMVLPPDEEKKPLRVSGNVGRPRRRRVV